MVTIQSLVFVEITVMTHLVMPLLLCVAAYIAGGIPFGFLMGKLRGVDVRTVGSGNIGATNVLRTMGVVPGVIVLVLDALKGYLPVLAANVLLAPDSQRDVWVILVGLCAVLGHTYTPFLRFNGGKGVATSLGVVFGLNAGIAGISLLLFLVVVGISRYVSLGSIMAAIVCAGLFWGWPNESLPARIFTTLIAVFVTVRHRKNIERLRQGTESKIGVPKPPAEPEAASDTP